MINEKQKIMEKTVIHFFNNGKNITPLNGKIPILKNWNNLNLQLHQIQNYIQNDHNFGWVLGPRDFVIDIDKKNDGFKSWEKFLKHVKLNSSEFNFTVITPTGGAHIYQILPEKFDNSLIQKTLKDFPGIDFLTEGNQCVIPHSEINGSKYYWYDENIAKLFKIPLTHENILNFFENNSSKTSAREDDFKIGMSIDQIENILKKLNPSMNYDEWMRVGMALHDYDTVYGLKLWEEWSKNGTNYQPGETEKKWKSFSSGKGITIGTLKFIEKSAIYQEKQDKINLFLADIMFADLKKIETEIIPKIKKETFSKIEKEKLVKTLQDRLKILHQVKLPIATIRELVENTQKTSELSDAPDWCKKWYYVNSHNAFINSENFRLHKTESFNIENGRFVPGDESKMSASKYVSAMGYIEKVDTIAYLPTIKDLICTIDGIKILNSFNFSSLPFPAENFTNDGLIAIEKIKKHIDFICGDHNSAKIFTEWLAHQIQFPGVKILWSPIIQSIQGVGKSFFADLLRGCLGDRNVGTVSPSQVTSDFNGWATDVVVNILEELRVKGHNRYDAINALKPLITDRMIQINEKGLKQYATYNTTNYICFTNYVDCVPLEEDDRRWWVIFTPIKSLNDLHLYVGENADKYFPNLFSALRSNLAEVKKWLSEFPISNEFLNLKQAPMTLHKMSVIATEESGIEGLIETRDMIREGGKYFNSDVICSSDLFSALSFKHPELEPKTCKRNMLLKKLGYRAVPQPITIDDKSRRVWTKIPMTASEIRQSLKLQ